MPPDGTFIGDTPRCRLWGAQPQNPTGHRLPGRGTAGLRVVSQPTSPQQGRAHTHTSIRGGAWSARLQLRLTNTEFTTAKAFRRFPKTKRGALPCYPEKAKVSFQLGREERGCRSWRSQRWQPDNCNCKSRTLVSSPCDFQSRSEPVPEPRFTSYPNYLDTGPRSSAG